MHSGLYRTAQEVGAYRTERRLGGGTSSGLDGIANYGISDEAERRRSERLEVK